MNCVQCNKPFTCGCQKHSVGNGVTIHKTCANDYNNSQVTQPPVKDLNLEIARQKVQDLRNR